VDACCSSGAGAFRRQPQTLAFLSDAIVLEDYGMIGASAALVASAAILLTIFR